MTTFFTVLIITYAFNGEEVQSRILYTSEMACSDAMLSIEAALDPDLNVEMLQCKRSDLISRSPRPMDRPEDLAHG
jgi:hypothetical protein